MTKKLQTLLSIFVLSAALFPIKASANVTTATGTWNSMVSGLKSNPLFSSLGLDDVVYKSGNSFSHTVTLKINGTSFVFEGTMDLTDTGATVTSVTNAAAQPGLTYGTLKATSGKLDVEISQSGDISARMTPGFPGVKDEPYLSITPDGRSLDYSLQGGSIELKDFSPAASAIPALGAFTLSSVSDDGGELTVAGTLNGKAVSVVREDDGSSVKVTGGDLKLSDLIPAVSGVPFLNAFAFDSITHTETAITVEGKIAGDDISVMKELNAKSFTVTGDGVKVSDFISEAANIPLLSKFAFTSLSYDGTTTSVSGTISRKAVSVVRDSADKTFTVTGDALELSDFIPAAAKIDFLDKLDFTGFTYTPTEIQITGDINGKTLTATRTVGADTNFTITGGDIKLTDVAPSASLKAFDAFALDKISVSASLLAVDGKLNGKALSLIKDRTKKNAVTVTAEGFVLSDVFSSLASIPAINSVAVDKIALDGESIEVDAKLNGDTIDVIAHVGDDGDYVAVYFADLEASAFIPAASGHAVDDLQLKNALFIIQPSNSKVTTVKASDLPGDLPSLVGWGRSETLTLSPGVNFAGTIDVTRSKSLSDALTAVGVTDGELPLRGTLSASSFKSMTGAAKAKASSLSADDTKSLLAGLDLKADLPLPKLPAIAGVVKVKSPITLELNGNAQNATSLWAKVPVPLQHERPTGDLDISATFGLTINGAGIDETLDAVVSLDEGSGTKGLSVLAILDGSWSKPLGIPNMTLDTAGFAFELQKAEGATSEEIEFFAETNIGSTKNIKVEADIAKGAKGITLNYFELDGKFKLSDIPGGSKIPHADQFELDEIKITEHGVEAKTTLAGNQVDAFLFDSDQGNGENWTFAIDQKNFKITELVTAAKKIKQLDAIVIKNAAVIISQKGLSGDHTKMGPIAVDLFKDIMGTSKVQLKIPAGIAVLTEFDPKMLGVIGEGLSKIGVHDDAIIMGALDGVFSGTPSVDLELIMDTMGAQHGLPQKAMSPKPGIDPPSFFVKWSGETLEVGVKLDMHIKTKGETLEMETDIDIEFSEEGLGIKLLAKLDGEWKKPFGIHGLSLENVAMDVQVTDVGEVKIGFAGEEQFGNCSNTSSPDCVDFKIAAELSMSLEDLLPDGVAFKASINQLGIAAIVDIAESLMGLKAGGLGHVKVPFFEIKNAMIAFATPGMTDPDLGLVSEGFAFGGHFWFMNKHLGDISGHGGPTSGVALKGDIADINLDILEFKKNDVDLAIGKDPHFILNSAIILLGDEQDIKIDIEPPHFEFDITEKLGVFGEADLQVRLDGFDLTKGTFDKNADISVIGYFRSQLIEWMKDHINKGLDELRISATAKLEADKRGLENDQKKVDGLNDDIRKIKAQDDAAKRRADSKLDSAKRRVSSLKGSYDHDIHEAHHCGHWYSHWACSPGWYIAAGATWIVYEAAEGALDIAEGIVAAAFALDPRIAGLVVARDVAHAALAIAEGVVDAAEAVEKFVFHVLKDIIDAVLDHLPFEIDQAIIIADLRDMIVHNKPMVFDLSFKMFGDPMREYFAIKIPDSAANIEFDVTSFALLPAIALDKLTEDALKKISPAAGRWVHAHIGEKLAGAEAKVRAEVQAEEKKYAKVLKTFETGSAKYRKAFSDHQTAIKTAVQKTQISDMMPDSKQFSNTYLAVGHSSLCLTVDRTGINVIQANCKDTAAERWSTAKLADGYVQLKSKGLCLKGRKGGSKDNYEPLILGPCNKKDKHEQWKIVSEDGYWDKIVNRDSQKCLHFNTENANPRTAFAVWTSCIGTASQQFRDIKDAQRPTWHPVNEFVKAKNNMCLSVTENSRLVSLFDRFFGKRRAEGILNAYEKMGWGLQLFGRSCGDSNERFNYVEEVNGDIILRHAKTGTCVYSYGNTNILAMRACDGGSDMRWRVNAVDGSYDQLYNVYHKKCLNIPSKKNALATAGSCSKNDSTLIDFAK